ncbi:hypothetical protein [Streptomyces arenae]|uniref:hypothetical protein n=1 Tax=Streptomyces arenae TaxID=29301 RepID=UPI002658A04C|nr:hypothetical protein [Streptomyces arenae]MCG7207459.1 S1 family peptidase [Streptomyces arenae]
MRSKRLAGVLMGVSALAGALAVPVPAWAAEAKPAASVKEPSQAQWKQLDEVAAKHSALGVFGADSGSAPVLMLPANTPAPGRAKSGAESDEKAKVLADVPSGMQVTVKVSRFAKGEVDKIQNEVADDAKWDNGAQKYRQGYAYDGVVDKVVVNTEAPASVRSALQRHLGDKVEVVQTRFEQQYNRFNDGFNDFLGGDSINDGSFNCTSGFKVHVVNPDTGIAADMMTTAGHCFSLNHLVVGANGNNEGWVKRIGSTDLEAFVGYRYGRNIWTGGYASSESSRTVASLQAITYNRQVCVSGQTTYNHCGHPISSINYAFDWTDSTGNRHHSNSWDGFTYAPGGTNAPNYDNGQHTQRGDSGAPVYIPYDVIGANNNTLHYAGIIGSHSGLYEWYNGPCHCTQYRMYGVKANFIHSGWGGYVVTN